MEVKPLNIILGVIPILFLISGIATNSFVVAPGVNQIQYHKAEAKEVEEKPKLTGSDKKSGVSEPEPEPKKKKSSNGADITQYASDSVKQKVRQEIKKVFEDDHAIQIAYCESRFNPKAINHADAEINGVPSVGVFQISLIHGHSKKVLFNYKENIRIAKSLYDENGWQPWKNCASKLDLIVS